MARPAQENLNGTDLSKPIPPSRPMKGWKDNPIDDKGAAFNEPLVPLGIFTEDHRSTYCPEIFTDGIYYGERDTSPYGVGELDGALITGFVREGVAKRLAQASQLLPPGYAFLVRDPLRTEQVQRSLFEHFKNKLMAPPFNYSEEVAIEKTQDYVSQPSRANSPHMTGGAVDLTIIEFEPEAWAEMQRLTAQLKSLPPPADPQGVDLTPLEERRYRIEMQRYALMREHSKMLDMGVAFDEVSADTLGNPKTALRYYEEKLERDGGLAPEDREPLKNRRILYNALSAVGFTFFPEEPWHADFGNKFWAQQSGAPAALYGYAAPSPENMWHEDIRRKHHANNIALNRRETPVQAMDKTGRVNSLVSTVFAIAQRLGGMRARGQHHLAERINPDKLMPLDAPQP
ncbi:MAG: M15 family metallopeptidase [Alphaproteobacteria bacterium]|nr:M15 family metallopeptidase [Alphaproteobacteria bacterium]